MEIQRISQKENFGRLYYSQSVVSKMKSKTFIKSLQEIKDIFAQNGFDRKKYVDVMLNYDDRGFYGVISSKKQGTPMNPDYLHNISGKKKDIDSFREWLNDWNYRYSPAGLRKLKELQDLAFSIMIGAKK